MKHNGILVVARIYSKLRGSFSAIRRYQHKYIKQYLESLPHRGLVLDVGSGISPYASYFSEGQYVTLDIDSAWHPCLVGDVYALPFKDSAFDTILCSDLLEHLPEPTPALNEIWRVLKDSGHLVLTVPFVFGVHGDHDYYRWTKLGLSELLTRHGFAVLQVKERGGIFALLAQILHWIADTIGSTFLPSHQNPTHIRNWPRYLLSLILRACFIPLTQVLLAMDFLDRRKDFTMGYVALAEKTAFPGAK